MYKDNINRIHFDITEIFENVNIREISDKKFRNHVRIDIDNEMRLVMFMEKNQLENNNFKWSYLADPNNEDSLIERCSSIESFKKDVSDIFEKKRFDQDYINSIK